MKAPVVKVHWVQGDHIYGVLLEGAGLIVAWDGANHPYVIPEEAFVSHELCGEEVDVPDDLIRIADHYSFLLKRLRSAYPEELWRRSLRESSSAAGYHLAEERSI